MQSTLTASVVWNVWVLLATPAIWLAYSMITFCAAILAFVWTSGTNVNPNPPSTKMATAPRVVVTAVFVLGIIVYIAVIRTFRSWTDEKVYIRNPLDQFDELEHAFPNNEHMDKEPANGAAELA
jgi:ABC-type dipeptide/oligopeptide/nickel transport system permease component